MEKQLDGINNMNTNLFFSAAHYNLEASIVLRWDLSMDWGCGVLRQSLCTETDQAKIGLNVEAESREIPLTASVPC